MAMRTFNLFRDNCYLYCAVPEDRPVPYFLTGGGWEFQGKVEGGPDNKFPKAAEVAIRFNGFYTFHHFEAPPKAA